MSRRICKALMLGAIVTSALASASSAPAWTTNGHQRFTATTGALRVTYTFGPTLNCSGPNAVTGTQNSWFTRALTGDIWRLTMDYAGCTVSGLAFTKSCTPVGSTSPLPATLNGVSYAAPVTTATLTNIQCVSTIPNCTVTLTGAVNATYSNTTFALTILSASQSLSYTATGASCSALGFGASGTATYTNGTGGNAVATVTTSPKPNITNP
jgi:hypothetical protein